MADRKEILTVIATLAAAYPHLNLTDATIDVYCDNLDDLPAGELMDSAREYIRRGSKFFPTIFELREPYEKRLKQEKQERDRREWKDRVNAWKSEALSPGEAPKLLAEVNERAGTKLVTSKGMSRVVKRDFETGREMTDEEWAERQRRVKERAGA